MGWVRMAQEGIRKWTHLVPAWWPALAVMQKVILNARVDNAPVNLGYRNVRIWGLAA